MWWIVGFVLIFLTGCAELTPEERQQNAAILGAAILSAGVNIYQQNNDIYWLNQQQQFWMNQQSLQMQQNQLLQQMLMKR